MKFLVVQNQWSKEHGYVEEGVELLRSSGEVKVITVQSPEDTGWDTYRKELPEADAVLFSPWYRPAHGAAVWKEAAKLQVIAGTFDNRFNGWIDLQERLTAGTVVVDTSRSMTPSVAEFALAMTLNLIRDIPASLELVRSGSWKSAPWSNPGFVFGDLTGRRVGLAGLGSINRRYAELLAPFRCDIRVYDSYVSDEAIGQYGSVRADSLVELAEHSEVLVVGIPPTPATQQIISREVIQALPMGALLVLVTRMAVMDQASLWERTSAGEIRAAIDVFEPEPPPEDAPFRTDPHVLPSPHVAGDTLYCHRRCFTDACVDALAALAGKPLRFQATLRDDKLYSGEGQQERPES
ncbi:NAD(P)-dependent oxidoreductase [Paenibacillus sp. GCM10023252]|uniref:NAD(P)-dependent oxidoreductase n=1 Tax=Paenibacillus sp. GCM10023252 TaxID=3252649 RepID=UPI003621C30D